MIILAKYNGGNNQTKSVRKVLLQNKAKIGHRSVSHGKAEASPNETARTKICSCFLSPVGSPLLSHYFLARLKPKTHTPHFCTYSCSKQTSRQEYMFWCNVITTLFPEIAMPVLEPTAPSGVLILATSLQLLLCLA